MPKSRKGNPNNAERQALRTWLIAHGVSTGDAAQLVAPDGRNREQQALVIIAYLRNGKKAKK